jgi:acyl carrier protein
MPGDPVVFEKIKAIVVDILGVEAAEVTPEAWFDGDLGGESIDLLDLGFRCERAFGARVRFQDLTAHDLTVGTDGALTPESLEKLQERFPLLAVSHWKDRRFDRPIQLLTIGDIAAVVESEIQNSAAVQSR